MRPYSSISRRGPDRARSAGRRAPMATNDFEHDEGCGLPTSARSRSPPQRLSAAPPSSVAAGAIVAAKSGGRTPMLVPGSDVVTRKDEQRKASRRWPTYAAACRPQHQSIHQRPSSDGLRQWRGPAVNGLRDHNQRDHAARNVGHQTRTPVGSRTPPPGCGSGCGRRTVRNLAPSPMRAYHSSTAKRCNDVGVRVPQGRSMNGS